MLRGPYLPLRFCPVAIAVADTYRPRTVALRHPDVQRPHIVAGKSNALFGSAVEASHDVFESGHVASDCELDVLLSQKLNVRLAALRVYFFEDCGKVFHKA